MLGGFPGPPWATFPQAPLRSRTVGFPESGSDLGFPPRAFPRAMRLKRWLACTPLARGLPMGSSLLRGRVRPGSASGRDLGPPSAQSPFARPRRYLGRERVLPALGARYHSFFAHTDSCASPKPSPPTSGLPYRVGSLQVAASPCWEMDLPDVISASLSLDAWICTPVPHKVLLPIASLVTSAFPVCHPQVGGHERPLETASCGYPFRGRQHSYTSSGLLLTGGYPEAADVAAKNGRGGASGSGQPGPVLELEAVVRSV